jgi:SAM-dependent methyltransferase
MPTSGSGYLLAGQMSELERLQLQSRVWEPAGQALLDRLGSGQGLRALDVGCGCFGWLRLLSQGVGPGGSVTGTDVDAKLLEAARALIKEDGLGNVGGRVSRDRWRGLTTLPRAGRRSLGQTDLGTGLRDHARLQPGSSAITLVC